jgi:hypothetical protein
MKKFRNGIFYIGIIGVFSILMYWIILLGIKLESGRNINTPQSGKSQWGEFTSSLLDGVDTLFATQSLGSVYLKQ